MAGSSGSGTYHLPRANYNLSGETGLGISQLRMTLTGIGKGGWWIRMFFCVLRFGFMYAMKVTLAYQLRLVHNGTKTNLVRCPAISPHFTIAHVVILVDVNDSCLPNSSCFLVLCGTSR